MNKSKELFASQIKELFKDLVGTISNSFIEESFYSAETILANLIIEEIIINDELIISAHLKEDYEYAFFHRIYFDESLDVFYHYTTLETLVHILNSGKVHLSSLTGMNDKSEINLVNRYMGNNLENPYNANTIYYHNSHFIMCFSQKSDDLNQWRLYGDDARGVMIRFEANIKNNNYKNILLCKVSYNLKVFQIIKDWLDFFRDSFNISFGLRTLDYWKFFYKNEDYIDESEVRLLINNMQKTGHKEFVEKFKINRYQIVVPYLEIDVLNEKENILNLTGIVLGPRLVEQELNAAQLGYLIKKKYNDSSKIEILQSKITHYR